MNFDYKPWIGAIIGIVFVLLGLGVDYYLDNYYFKSGPLTKVTYSTTDKFIFNIPTLLFVTGGIAALILGKKFKRTKEV